MTLATDPRIEQLRLLLLRAFLVRLGWHVNRQAQVTIPWCQEIDLDMQGWWDEHT